MTAAALMPRPQSPDRGGWHGVPYDPSRRDGWARGLIHTHTQFSDGWASPVRAGEIARDAGYDFLVVTDHIRNLKLVTRKTLDQYVQACEEATHKLGIPVIPGAEMEVHWNSAATSDFSEAHTLTLSILPLVAFRDCDWTTPEAYPFAAWPDSQGGTGTILALQEKLRRYDLPPQASHQFQHSLLSTKRGEHSDYRYDLDRLPGGRYFDFFYSGSPGSTGRMRRRCASRRSGRLWRSYQRSGNVSCSSTRKGTWTSEALTAAAAGTPSTQGWPTYASMPS